jgi:hypothetical protein
MKSRAPRRSPRPAGSPRRGRRRSPSSVPLVAPNASSGARSPAPSVPVDMQPLTKSVIFALLWMTLVGFYLFNGPRGFGPVPVEVSWLLVGTTIFSLVVLGRRFPLFGWFLLVILSGLMSGGRRRRW